MYETITNPLKEKMDKTVEHFKGEIAALRTGRASSALVESVMVDYFGQMTPIYQVASISVQPPSTIVVKPWDRSVIPAIEAGIRGANLGLSPVTESDFVRVTVPILTQERRDQLAKILGQKAEEAKVSIRQEREVAIKEIDKLEKDGKFTEDDKYQSKETVQKIVDDYNNKIKELRDAKEAEISEK